MAGENATGNILTWNIENWATVVLMGLVGFGLWGAAQAWWAKRNKATA